MGMTSLAAPGPLAGVRVVELEGLGPAPHAAMMLADLGAEVVRVERADGGGLRLHDARPDPVLRGRARTVRVDLRTAEGVDEVLGLVEEADVLVEGLRPGVAERLGVGPEDCAARNDRLVYVRVTGWGQDGPWAGHVGHDINYVGLTGALHAIGAADRPPAPPLNLVGDFGGGSMLAVVGALAALVARASTGRGQVVDAAMVDGTAVLSQLTLGLMAAGRWSLERQANLLDGGAPFYRTYACADGRYVAVGSLEPRFYAALLDGLGLEAGSLPDREDPTAWPRLHELLEKAFLAQSRDAWAAHFEGTEACVTPVLTYAEAAEHPHLRARATYLVRDGAPQAAAAPRFSPPGGPPAR
ncbi:CaiB/BaiF CoA transferase family protein [Ornithinimicrobium tianjinense]|uniref:Alpha-methylacyl-CoA racemase n=1 Tax=Ornithinimicrobium tianjinense TaxID=1195761 RepID=A0A917F991_9MICO|nr:CaiB/BaiF CoA-transferase family protein [Ornithinimicrobium tianjinense]GGF59252.1 alpha-methylacyl-CoA racemase [Ornithinimicrobium tianjinense]